MLGAKSGTTIDYHYTFLRRMKTGVEGKSKLKRKLFLFFSIHEEGLQRFTNGVLQNKKGAPCACTRRPFFHSLQCGKHSRLASGFTHLVSSQATSRTADPTEWRDVFQPRR